ncbi:MAG: HNH endonuclease domain-containing protein [Chitinophagaceae bacterium]|nr:HNH endonuclease domain-containing protein [Chitinophagaceae bacterium]
MKKILGLDLGSSSIGWALRNEENEVKTGVVTFDSGMIKGTGGYTSPTKDRREARSKRRLLQARKYRKWALLEVLLEKYTPLQKEELELWSKYGKGQLQKFPESEKFLLWLKCDFSYLGNMIKYKNPYELRVKALDEKLHPHEFGRALYHLVQRRGYKNIGESDTDDLNIEEAKKDTETKKQLERREAEGFALALQNNRSVAEALNKEFLEKSKRARNQYPLRKEYRQELELLCKTQGFDIARNDSGSYKNPFIQHLWKAIIWQRPLRSQKGNIGRCTLEKDKPRCPVSHPLFEIFRAWQFINTIKYTNADGIKQKLSQEIRIKLFNEFFLKKGKNEKFSEIKKFLDKKVKEKKQYNYKDDHSAATMPVCKGLIDVFGESVESQIKDLYKYNIGDALKIIEAKYSVFDLWHALYSFDEAYLHYFAVQKLGVEDETTKKGKKINPLVELKKCVASSFSDLSIKAISKIIPFLEDGFLYNEAVLMAKMPDLLGREWEIKKEQIFQCIKLCNEKYNWHKAITTISNSLVDAWKGLASGEKFAYKDISYVLQADDINDIVNACSKHYGERTWNNKPTEIKNKILDEVKIHYQDFFKDSKRTYREAPTLDDILSSGFDNLGIHLNGELYHHSKRENLYLKKIGTLPDGSLKLPIDKKTGKEILPTPLIDSIKNPMFNKALSVLRKLLNELIINNVIDEETEVVVEVARELNDNNKRIAIEKYQRNRENKRELYRKFLEEFKEKENVQINIDEKLSDFELWNEQIFDKTKIKDEKSGKEKEIPTREYILKQKNAVKRYELWIEQKGQCMYTGKMISITQLFSSEIDIEHTIPRSLLPDNTMTNQTICYAWYNRDKKKNQLPTQCENFRNDINGWGTAIEPRLKHWIELREHYENLYEDHKKAKPGEDEENKNKRIQKKHEFKMYLDYWTDKVERFTCEEIKESWVRRQLTDTQMISKYAREFLNIYFGKVKVQKGSVTADFRKMYSFQEEDEIKNRNKHTHHAIDAAVLTLIPTNSSYRERLLKTMYEWEEQNRGQFTTRPFENFNSQALIRSIENEILVVNHQKDKILKRTFKTVRNRGRIIYVKDRQGNYILDRNGSRVIKKSKGDSIRTTLYKQIFVGKLRDVERDKDGKPLRNDDGLWKFKTGSEGFFYAERVSIEKAKKYINDIVDPEIKKLVNKQKNNHIVKDYQGNIIRHVRIRTTVGKIVKQRLNYQSKYDYKNSYYAASGSLPYAAFLQIVTDREVERKLIPIASAELGKMYKKHGPFNIDKFIEENYPEYRHFPDKKLLKVGQKVFVLNNDEEFERRSDKDFQVKRLYKITQFSEGSIWLKYHLESQDITDIKNSIKDIKDKLLSEYEGKLDLPMVMEDFSIEDINERKNDFEDRKYRFNSFKTDYRLIRLAEKIGLDEAKRIKEKLDQFAAFSGSIKVEGQTPLLKLSQENWNFLLEGEDFEISLSGKLTFK